MYTCTNLSVNVIVRLSHLWSKIYIYSESLKVSCNSS